jgi:hypothetical protein
MVKSRHILWLVPIYLCSCNQHKQPEKPAFKTEILDTIGMSTLYQAYYGKDAPKIIEHNSKIFPIYSIENGVDSFELRLKIHPELIGATELDIIKFVDNEWIGEHLFILYGREWSGWDSVTIKRFAPKCGWKNFIDTLYNSDLFILPSQRQIKNFEDGIDDGTNYTLELATKGRYRRISYHDPGAFTDSFDEKFWNVLLFINRNIQLPFIDKSVEMYRHRMMRYSLEHLIRSLKQVKGPVDLFNCF